MAFSPYGKTAARPKRSAYNNERKERESFVEQIRKNAHLVNYNHDGRAVERITMEINKALL